MASKLATHLDWQALLKAEPRLRGVEQAALNAYRFGFREERDWEVIKRLLQSLVDWNAREPELGTPLAYDVAYRHLRACWSGGRRS